ncbi:MAG TPA: hypothetical protein VLK82_21210 [Candidatus Tectomicrobia bacterium]|nr:hypothetical protein [Candidatus Tectomicrobia bacterium]
MANVFNRHPAEVLGEDDEVGSLADFEAALKPLLKRFERPWTSKPTSHREPPR